MDVYVDRFRVDAKTKGFPLGAGREEYQKNIIYVVGDQISLRIPSFSSYIPDLIYLIYANAPHSPRDWK